MPLTLPILWNNEEQTEMLKLGIEPDSPPDYRKITFYTIDHIYEADSTSLKRKCTAIVSGGQEYLCDDTVQNINLAIINKL